MYCTGGAESAEKHSRTPGTPGLTVGDGQPFHSPLFWSHNISFQHETKSSKYIYQQLLGGMQL